MCKFRKTNFSSKLRKEGAINNLYAKKNSLAYKIIFYQDENIQGKGLWPLSPLEKFSLMVTLNIFNWTDQTKINLWKIVVKSKTC